MKAFIHPNADDKARDELRLILEEADCEIVDDLDELDCEDLAEQPPACVIVLDDGLSEADLEPILTQAVGCRCKVIGVWPRGAAGNVSPLGDYGADTVPWDNRRIRDAICGISQHLGPNGEEVKLPKSTHGGCVK